MATMNISLPDQMKKWIEAQVSTGKYANVSDFVRDVLREKLDYNQRVVHLRALIEEGDNSGLSNDTLNDVWGDIEEKHPND